MSHKVEGESYSRILLWTSLIGLGVGFLIVLILHIKAIKIAATGNVSGSNEWFGFWGTVWSTPVGSVLLFELEVYSYSLWVIANWLFIGFIAGVIISLYDLAIEKLPPRRPRF